MHAFLVIAVFLLLSSSAVGAQQVAPCQALIEHLAGFTKEQTATLGNALEARVYYPGREEYHSWAKTQKQWSSEIAYTGARAIFSKKLEQSGLAVHLAPEICTGLVEEYARNAYWYVAGNAFKRNLAAIQEGLKRTARPPIQNLDLLFK